MKIIHVADDFHPLWRMLGDGLGRMKPKDSPLLTLVGLRRIIRALDVLLHDPEQDPMRRAFTLWIKCLTSRRSVDKKVDRRL
ncbi:MAG: hypothetical protein LBS49_09965 [Candidatus Accumulibacter sp.]|jgi:hypothetical protein|nr:hypothetical protein [Accumulibacter sp.]